MSRDVHAIRADVETEERVAFEHEHAGLYAALLRASHMAELAGDEAIADDLKVLRRKVARHIDEGRCS